MKDIKSYVYKNSMLELLKNMEVLMKKLLVILLATFVVASNLFANGKPEETEKPDDSKTVISIMHYMGEEAKRNGLQTLCDTYSSIHPNVEFEIQAVPYSQFGQQLQTKIAAGDVPDIIGGRPRDFKQFVNAGHIEVLDGQPFINDLPESFKNEMSLDGKVYGIPLDYSIKGVFYNVDMFKEFGVKVPRTYNDFIKVLDTFEAANQIPFARPFKDTNAPETDFKGSFHVTLAKQNPTMWEDIATGKKHITNFPIFKEELTKYVKRMSYSSFDDYAYDGSRALQIFAAGDAPMMINGAWITGDLLSLNPDGNFGCFPIPWSNNPEDNQYEVKGDDAMMVAKGSENKEIAIDFINFVGSVEGANIWMDKARLIPTNVNVVADESMPTLLKELSSNLSNGWGCSSANVLELTGEPKAIYRQSLHALVGSDNLKSDLDGFIKQLDKDLTSSLAK